MACHKAATKRAISAVFSLEIHVWEKSTPMARKNSLINPIFGL